MDLKSAMADVDKKYWEKVIKTTAKNLDHSIKRLENHLDEKEKHKTNSKKELSLM
jgi:hypothetical protein